MKIFPIALGALCALIVTPSVYAQPAQTALEGEWT
jgi:hypothetical protein